MLRAAGLKQSSVEKEPHDSGPRNGLVRPFAPNSKYTRGTANGNVPAREHVRGEPARDRTGKGKQSDIQDAAMGQRFNI